MSDLWVPEIVSRHATCEYACGVPEVCSVLRPVSMAAQGHRE